MSRRSEVISRMIPPDALAARPPGTPFISDYVIIDKERKSNGRIIQRSRTGIRPSYTRDNDGSVHAQASLSRADIESTKKISTLNVIEAIRKFCLEKPLMGTDGASGRALKRRVDVITDQSLSMRAYRVARPSGITTAIDPLTTAGTYHLDVWDNTLALGAGHYAVNPQSFGTAFELPYEAGEIESPHSMLWRRIVDGAVDDYKREGSVALTNLKHEKKPTPFSSTMDINPHQLVDPSRTLAYLSGAIVAMLSHEVH